MNKFWKRGFLMLVVGCTSALIVSDLEAGFRRRRRGYSNNNYSGGYNSGGNYNYGNYGAGYSGYGNYGADAGANMAVPQASVNAPGVNVDAAHGSANVNAPGVNVGPGASVRPVQTDADVRGNANVRGDTNVPPAAPAP